MIGRLDLLHGETMIMPGDQATVRVSIPDKMPLMEGQNFTLRENKITVGTGRIVSLKVSTYEGCLSVTIMLKHLNNFFSGSNSRSSKV